MLALCNILGSGIAPGPETASPSTVTNVPSINTVVFTIGTTTGLGSCGGTGGTRGLIGTPVTDEYGIPCVTSTIFTDIFAYLIVVNVFIVGLRESNGYAAVGFADGVSTAVNPSICPVPVNAISFLWKRLAILPYYYVCNLMYLRDFRNHHPMGVDTSMLVALIAISVGPGSAISRIMLGGRSPTSAAAFVTLPSF